ncbi:MAG: hypothetical protein JWM78_2455 [Verrucomicrobiaceae bacterium]|nr:hypothetical protein [Verrucomicrobiaceae bacterium]
MAQKRSGPLFYKAPARKAEKNPAGLSSNTSIELNIERLSAEGRGMAFRDRKPVFVPYALPGETVRACIVNDKREFAEAQLLEVLTPAPQRQIPPCELFGRCGGCQLQMLGADEQIAHKQQSLQRLLRGFVSEDSSVWQPTLSAQPWYYRHRARLAVAEQDGKPIVGFRAANSHHVLAVSSCPILDTRLQPLLQLLPQWLEQLPQWRRIEEILVAVDSGNNIAVAWHAQRAFPKADADKLEALCRAANVLCGDGAQLNYAVPSQATSIAFTPNDFTQVNPAINDQLAARVIDWLAPTAEDSVADFFCGLGNFTLPLARRAKTAVGYEVSAAMVARARANAMAQNIGNARFEVLDLFEPIAEFTLTENKILLDPPRAGAKLLCETLATLKSVQRIVYVSCNPQTLTRDIEILAKGGFVLQHAALVEMFPQTGHSEAVVCLARK